MCGIFAYLNHEVSRDRRTILKTLIAGLKRLEYRGYDSAGLACDGANQSTLVVKRSGKVVNLEQAIETHPELKDFMDTPLSNHSGIAHTRWATHGPPNEVNCHPHLSTPDAEFTVVHNGIITNCRDLRALLERKGCVFVSETDTESIAKLVKFVYDKKLAASDGEKPDFHEVVEDTTSQLEGAFALVFKSNHYPHQLVATRRGSPLLVGIKPNLEVSCGQLPAMIQVHKMEARRPYDEADESQLLATSAATTATTATTAPSTTTAAVAAGPDIIDLGASGAGKAGGSLANRVPSVSEYGVGEPVEYFFASDASAIVEHTKKIVYLEDEDIASIKDGRINIHRSKLRSGQVPQTREIKTVEIELQEIMKGKFSHFMVKEIYEQPESTTNTMRGRLRPDAAAAAAGGSQVVLGGLKEHIASMKRCRRLLFIACGTSYNSAIATRQFLEESTLLPVVCDIASDFLDRQCPIFRDDVCFFISQSGETADTLAALRYCKARGALIVGITNTVGSSISRESDCGVHANAGPEIGVASTKAYTSQVLVMILFGLTMSEDQVSAQPRRAEVIQALQELPGKIQQMIEMDDAIKLAAARFTNAENLLIMGRGYSFANCLEGALKIKELTYIHAEGILAGELKHGPLALVDSDMPIIMLLMRDSSYTKSINALEQIVARGGRPLVICPEGDIPTVGGADAFDAIEVPSTADCLACVLSIIPLQLLSYHIACAKGLDVDCPRNLAKSVTVE